MTAARPAVRWGATVGATVAGALVVVLAASAASADGRRGVVVFGIAGVLLLIAGLVFGSGVYPAGLVAIGVSFAFSLAGHQVGSVEVITATALLLLVDQLAAWAFDAATGAVERGRAISGRCLRVVAIVLIGAAVEPRWSCLQGISLCPADSRRKRSASPLLSVCSRLPRSRRWEHWGRAVRTVRRVAISSAPMRSQRAAVRVDPSTGLKLFDTKAAPDGTITGSGYGVLADESLKVLPEQPAGAVFDAVEQAKYRAYKEARRGAADYMAMEGDFAKYLRGRLLDRSGASGGVDGRMRDPRRRCGVRRAVALAQADGGGLRRRPVLREGWRRRRHVVLEPVSGHRLRRRVVQLPPAARGDGLRPVDEVRVGLRDLRVLPSDGRAVRVLRALPVPHHGRANRVGRDDRTLDGVHRPRRRDAGALRDPRQRHPHHAEAGADPRDGDVRGRLVPHLAVELRRRSARKARRDHRHRSDSSAGDPRAGQGGRRALRLPADPLDHRRARSAGRRRPRSATPGQTSPAGRALGVLASRRSRRVARRSRPTTTTSPDGSPTTRSASSTSAG